jgi:hypothetical protein
VPVRTKARPATKKTGTNIRRMLHLQPPGEYDRPGHTRAVGAGFGGHTRE